MNKNKIIELPELSSIKNIQQLFNKINESLIGKQKILLKGHISSCDLTLAQLIIQLRKEYSNRIEFDFSTDTEIDMLLSKAGIKLQ